MQQQQRCIHTSQVMQRTSLQNIELINKASPEQALQIAEKYITRDRMIGVVVEPMDEEERILREQQAGKSSTQ